LDQLRLCLVTDRHHGRGRDLATVVLECLAAGLPAVQVRDKELPPDELLALCLQLKRPVRESGALLIVNDRVDVALAAEADGVQRTSTSLPIDHIRAIAGRRLRIGASVHSLDEAVEAEAQGADWVVFGPVYDTPSKRRYGAPQGVDALRKVTGRLRVPVVAIGGITPARVRQVREAGAHGVAVIAAILDAPSPADAVGSFLEALAS
jgi:thiamine-phosphate pyrophosphorylase